MAVLTQPETRLLTIEDYRSEDEINLRYDILDGERIFMASPGLLHQQVCGNLYGILRTYQRMHRRGRAIIAPLDVLISRVPLRTRQPDIFFISLSRLQSAGGTDAEIPLVVAPELVIEVLSGSDTLATRLAKINDFCRIGVEECWLVSLERETVELLRLTPNGPVRVAVYTSGQTLQSLVFPDLTVALSDIFETED